jgi:hypothetical protein
MKQFIFQQFYWFFNKFIYKLMLKNTNKFFFSQQIYWFLPYSMGIISHNIYVIKIHGSQLPSLNVAFFIGDIFSNGKINSENVKSTEYCLSVCLRQCTKTSILEKKNSVQLMKLGPESKRRLLHKSLLCWQFCSSNASIPFIIKESCISSCPMSMFSYP